MQNGLTALLTIKPLLQALSCYCIIDKNNKIITSSASCVSLLSLDFKSFEGEALASIFFHFSYATVDSFKDIYTKDQILKGEFAERGEEKTNFQEKYLVRQQERYGFKFVEIRRLKGQKVLKKESRVQTVADFQFQVDVNTSKLKYLGSANNAESFVSQFSQMQLQNMASQVQKKVNYAEGISTLRLINNVVQLIEEQQLADSQQFIQRDRMAASMQEVIPRQD